MCACILEGQGRCTATTMRLMALSLPCNLLLTTSCELQDGYRKRKKSLNKLLDVNGFVVVLAQGSSGSPSLAYNLNSPSHPGPGFTCRVTRSRSGGRSQGAAALGGAARQRSCRDHSVLLTTRESREGPGVGGPSLLSQCRLLRMLRLGESAATPRCLCR